jgi:hypothetical protein
VEPVIIISETPVYVVRENGQAHRLPHECTTSVKDGMSILLLRPSTFLRHSNSETLARIMATIQGT